MTQPTKTLVLRLKPRIDGIQFQILVLSSGEVIEFNALEDVQSFLARHFQALHPHESA